MKKISGLEKRINLTELFDLYGPILTVKQREVFELHELMDLSLGEISEKTGVSRQAAHDLLQRAIERLTDLDQELSFSRKVRDYEERLEKIREILNRWQSELPGSFLAQVDQIINSGGYPNV